MCLALCSSLELQRWINIIPTLLPPTVRCTAKCLPSSVTRCEKKTRVREDLGRLSSTGDIWTASWKMHTSLRRWEKTRWRIPDRNNICKERGIKGTFIEEQVIRGSWCMECRRKTKEGKIEKAEWGQTVKGIWTSSCSQQRAHGGFKQESERSGLFYQQVTLPQSGGWPRRGWW